MGSRFVKRTVGDTYMYNLHYDTIDEHYTVLVNEYFFNRPMIDLLGEKELVIDESTGYVKSVNITKKSHQVWFDANRNAYIHAVYEFNNDKYQHIINSIKSRIISMGLIPDSYEKFIRIDENRDVYVPRKISGIYRGLTIWVASENAKGNYITYDDLIYHILHEIKKKDFLQRKILTVLYEDFVLTTKVPRFRRDISNKDKSTFDFIDIEMVVRSTDATKEKVNANKQEIFDKAIAKLEVNKQFQKYGVPVNFLKMYQFVIRKDGTLIISFCIKDKVKGD